MKIALYLSQPGHSPQWSTACQLGSRKWVPHLAWCCWHPLQSQFCHQWAKPCLTWDKLSLGQPAADKWCHSTSCGHTACTASTWWVSAYTTAAESTGVIAGFFLGHQGQHQKPGTWFFFMLIRRSLLFMPASHTLSFKLGWKICIETPQAWLNFEFFYTSVYFLVSNFITELPKHG